MRVRMIRISTKEVVAIFTVGGISARLRFTLIIT